MMRLTRLLKLAGDRVLKDTEPCGIARTQYADLFWAAEDRILYMEDKMRDVAMTCDDEHVANEIMNIIEGKR